MGRFFCAACKNQAVANQPMAEGAMMPCKEANEALTYAIVGLFCFGIILEPIALVKANKARKMIALNPRLTGSGKVTAATVIAIVGLALWVIGLIIRVAAMTHRSM